MPQIVHPQALQTTGSDRWFPRLPPERAAVECWPASTCHQQSVRLRSHHLVHVLLDLNHDRPRDRDDTARALRLRLPEREWLAVDLDRSLVDRDPRPQDVRVGNLSAAQQRAVLALIDGGSTNEAATAAGVTPRSIRRWLASDDFRAAYRAASRTAAGEALSRLLSAQSRAVGTLVDCLGAPSHATRVRAARALLEIGTRAIDDDLDERLDELEREMAAWRADAPRGLVVV